MKPVTRKSVMPLIAAGSLTFASTLVLAAPGATVGAGSSSSSTSPIGGHNSNSGMMGSASNSGLSANGEMEAALETDMLREEEEAQFSASQTSQDSANARVLPGLEEPNTNTETDSQPAGETADRLPNSRGDSVAETNSSPTPSTGDTGEADNAAPSAPSTDDADRSPGFFERLFGGGESRPDSAEETTDTAQNSVAGADAPNAPDSDREMPSGSSAPESDRAEKARESAEDRVSSAETPDKPSAPSSDEVDRSPGILERLFGGAESTADSADEAKDTAQNRVAGADAPNAPDSDREMPSGSSAPESDRAEKARESAEDRVSSAETPDKPSAQSTPSTAEVDRSPSLFERLFGGVDSNKDAEPVREAFGRLDVDDDELISRQEADGSRQVNANFDALDADGSGHLNREEFSKIQSLASK